jgi:hypothetical protein
MNLRVRLRPTDRTDVLCVSCGGFQADHVIVRSDGIETDSGCHKKCADEVQMKFHKKSRSKPQLPKTGTED